MAILDAVIIYSVSTKLAANPISSIPRALNLVPLLITLLRDINAIEISFPAILPEAIPINP